MTFGPRPVRKWCVLVALFAIVCSLALTAIALTPLHGHRQQGNCDICASVHLPLLQASQRVSLAAPGVVVGEIVREQIQSIPESYSGSADSRAPPFES